MAANTSTLNEKALTSVKPKIDERHLIMDKVYDPIGKCQRPFSGWFVFLVGNNRLRDGRFAWGYPTGAENLHLPCEFFGILVLLWETAVCETAVLFDGGRQ